MRVLLERKRAFSDQAWRVVARCNASMPRAGRMCLRRAQFCLGGGTHVENDHLDPRRAEHLPDAWQLPAGGGERVLVDEVPAVPDLVVVECLVRSNARTPRCGSLQSKMATEKYPSI